MSDPLGDDDDDCRNDGYESSDAHPRGTLSCFHVQPSPYNGPVRQLGVQLLEQTSVAVRLCQKKRRGIATAAQGYQGDRKCKLSFIGSVPTGIDVNVVVLLFETEQSG